MDIAPWRLNLLRAVYLLMALGSGWLNWTQILDPDRQWELMQGVVTCMLGAMALLSVLGIFQPLRMLPLLFWEMTWKLIWLVRVALPQALSGTMDPGVEANLFPVGLVVIILLATPWDHVWRRYLRGTIEPWRKP